MPSFFLKSGGDDSHNVRRREYADQHDYGSDESQNAEHCVCRFRRLFFVFLGQQLRVDRNERSGECAFAEDVLKEVRNTKGRAKCVALRRAAEVVRENALADEADDAANQNSGANEERRAPGAGRCCFRRCGWFEWRRAYLFDSFTGDRTGGFVGGDFGISCQRAYSFILLRSVL